MNQGRIWCVVNPTVGLPLFLGSVAATSLIVHASVLGNVSWFGAYWNGKAPAKAAAAETTTPVVVGANGAGVTISVAPVTAPNGETTYVISMTPKPAAPADVASGDTPVTLASSQVK